MLASMPLIAAGDFVVSPSVGLIAWAAFIWLAGGITAAKGLWRWLLIGLLTGGMLWFVTAFFKADPTSLWVRRFHRSDKPRLPASN